jgi:lysophospholipase L1-like esterase
MKIVLPLIAFLFLSGQTQDKITLHLIGDSTCAYKAENRRPETGWGEKFEHFFVETIEVRNYAQNGRSTRTFIEEHRWDSVSAALQAGDYVFIQFGHNDEVPTKKSYTTPENFKANLKRFISETRAKAARPVLLTPVSRRRFDESGNFFDTHGEYATLVRQVAEETAVPFIDMHTISMSILVQYGKTKSTKLFLHCAEGECPNYPKGITDDTHFSDFGATVMAEALSKAIWDSSIPLKNYVLRP